MIYLEQMERRLQEALLLPRRPVAVAFRDTAPTDVPQFECSEPSGCSFWRLAAEGRAFYTVSADHYNCVIGAYTHNIPLSPDRAGELEGTLGFMTEIGYVKIEEVPSIPRLERTPAAVVYAPLGDMPVEPDAVFMSGRPGRMMLVYEAAIRAGVASNLPLMGRPTCMALPAAQSHGVVMSSGCIGNRVYTDIGEDELYVVIPGRDLRRVVDALDTVVSANATLDEYHKGRRLQLASQ